MRAKEFLEGHFGATWSKLGPIFGVHRILKGFPRVTIFRTNIICWWILDARMEGLKWEKRSFRLHLLQFTRFRWSRKSIENRSLNGINKSSKLKPWAPQVGFFDIVMDLGKFSFSCLLFVPPKDGPKSRTNRLWGGRMGPITLFWTAIKIQVGHYTGRFQLESTFSYLTTPDTGRCRQFLAPTGVWRGSKIYLLTQEINMK